MGYIASTFVLFLYARKIYLFRRYETGLSKQGTHQLWSKLMRHQIKAKKETKYTSRSTRAFSTLCTYEKVHLQCLWRNVSIFMIGRFWNLWQEATRRLVLISFGENPSVNARSVYYQYWWNMLWKPIRRSFQVCHLLIEWTACYAVYFVHICTLY